MNSGITNDPLDRLLSRPAVVLDKGFSEQVKSQIVRSSRRKNRIYAWVALAWFFSALLLSSPSQVVLLMGQLATAFSQLPSSTLELTSTLRNELLQSPDITLSPSLVILMLLAMYAVANLLREKI